MKKTVLCFILLYLCIPAFSQQQARPKCIITLIETNGKVGTKAAYKAGDGQTVPSPDLTTFFNSGGELEIMNSMGSTATIRLRSSSDLFTNSLPLAVGQSVSFRFDNGKKFEPGANVLPIAEGKSVLNVEIDLTNPVKKIVPVSSLLQKKTPTTFAQKRPSLTIEIIDNEGIEVDTTVNYRDEKGKIIPNADPVKLFKNGGELIIKNNRNSDATVQLIAETSVTEKALLTMPLSLSAGQSKVFSFDKDQQLRGNPDLLNKFVGFPILKTKIQLISPLNFKIPLDRFLQGEIQPSKQGNFYTNRKDSLDCNCDNENLIYYDFSCKQFYTLEGARRNYLTNTRRLGYKRMIQLKIENINRYIYNVTTSGTEVVNESEIPPLLRQLFLGDSTLLTRLINNVSAGTQSADFIPENKFDSKYQKFIEAVELLNKYYDKLEEERLKAFYLCNNFSCCNINDIDITLSDILTALRTVSTTLYDLRKAIAEDKDINTQKADLLAALEKLANCKKTENEIADLEKQIAELKKIEKPTDQQKKDLTDLTVKRDKLTKCTAEEIALYKQQVQNLKDQLAFYSDIDSLQKQLPSKLELEKLFLFVQNKRKPHSYYLSPPIYPSGNRLELAVKISVNEKSLTSEWNTMPHYNDSLYLNIPTLLRPFVSFSSGSFVSFGNNLRNKTYAWQSLPDGANQVDSLSRKYILSERGYSTPVMGFAALVNLEVKVAPAIGFGASAGVGLTIEKQPRIVYLAGLSLFFGDVRQLAITGGLAGMQIDQLANNLQAVSNQNTVYNSRIAIDYYKEFKVGGFISITYTPFTNSSKLISKSITKK